MADNKPQGQTATDDESEVELASRLTVKDLGVDQRAALKTIKEKNLPKIAIARMYGVVSRVGFQEDRATGATYTFFVGSFEGQNMQTGEVLQSSKMYLPEGAAQTLEHVVNQTQQKRGKNATVHFAFEIRLVPNSEARSGYVYETAAILKAEHTDQLAAVRAIVEAASKPKAAETAKPTERKTA